MLALKRQSHETILVLTEGRLIATIMAESCGDNRVKVSFQADQSITIVRGELTTRHGEVPAVYACRRCGAERVVLALDGGVLERCLQCGAFDFDLISSGYETMEPSA